MKRSFLLLFILCSLFFLSCQDETIYNSDNPEIDELLTANIQGIVASTSGASVYLIQSDTVASTKVSNGFFQFTDIEYGLYALLVVGEDSGVYKDIISINRESVDLDLIELKHYPWPVIDLFPEDSLVITQPNSGYSRNFIMIEFSEYMDKPSVNNAISIQPGNHPFYIEWEVNNTGSHQAFIRIDPASMDSGSTYYLQLDSTARTHTGNLFGKVIKHPVKNRLSPSLSLTSIESEIVDKYITYTSSIQIAFSEPAVTKSVIENLKTDSTMKFETKWNSSKDTLTLVPLLGKWSKEQAMWLSLSPGYKSVSGARGQSLNSSIYFEGFDLKDTPPALIQVTNELVLEFNYGVQFESLQYSLDSSLNHKVTQESPNIIKWTFFSWETGTYNTLEIDALLSVYGDALDPITLQLIQAGNPSVFRALRSGTKPPVISPVRDSLVYKCSKENYFRLKDREFDIKPFFPFEFKWNDGDDSSSALVIFNQPIPANTDFIVFPDSNALPGDSIYFSSAPIKILRSTPLYKQNNFPPGDPITIEWNTVIDTIPDSLRIQFSPPLDSFHILHYEKSGSYFTTITYDSLTSSTDYTIQIQGVEDLFGRQAKNFTLPFRTR